MPSKVVLVPADMDLGSGIKDELVRTLSGFFPDATVVLLPGVRGSITFVEIPDPPAVPTVH